MLNKNLTNEAEMDDLKEQFLAALRQEIARAGSQTELAKKIGVQQSRISDYLTGRYDFSNMTIGTLQKFFPELQLSFSGSAHPDSSAVEKELEKQVLELFRSLPPDAKARYVMLVSAQFGSVSC